MTPQNLFFIIFAVFGTTNCLKRSDRILGGVLVKHAETYPFMASIKVSKTPNIFSSCGGTIINNRWILTAAHCVFKANISTITVFLGSNIYEAGERHKVEKTITHPEYYPKSNDIGLIKLKNPITYSSKIQKIPLNTDKVPENTKATIIGWGKTSTNQFNGPPLILRAVNVQTVSCPAINLVDILREIFGNTDQSKLVCTSTDYHKGACNGDSGGPLIMGNSQIGIVSNGLPCATGFPDFYMAVASYAPWILKMVKENNV